MPLESQYAPRFSAKTGSTAKPFQMAFGALYIQQRQGVTDRETVQLITQSPYLQFFIGLSAYQAMPPFEQFVAAYDKTKVPFKWTATADSILEKLQRLCSQICGTPH